MYGDGAHRAPFPISCCMRHLSCHEFCGVHFPRNLHGKEYTLWTGCILADVPQVGKVQKLLCRPITDLDLLPQPHMQKQICHALPVCRHDYPTALGGFPSSPLVSLWPKRVEEKKVERSPLLEWH